MSVELRSVLLGAVIAFIFVILGVPVGWSIGIGTFVGISTIMAEKDSK